MYWISHLTLYIYIQERDMFHIYIYIHTAHTQSANLIIVSASFYRVSCVSLPLLYDVRFVVFVVVVVFVWFKRRSLAQQTCRKHRVRDFLPLFHSPSLTQLSFSFFFSVFLSIYLSTIFTAFALF